MKSKLHVGLVATLIGAIGAVGLFESLEAAPKESQRLRGMEGRAFLVDAFRFDENGDPVQTDGGYCYIFNSDAEWVDERFPVPGTWEQDSIGASTSYMAMASAEFEGFGLVELFQDGRVTPARGSGVLQLEAITEVYLEPFGLIDVVLAIGHEVAADECSIPPPD